MLPTKNDLPEETRAKIVELCNARLADLIDLQLQSKQAHWNVRGPRFIQLHLLFDQVFTVVTGLVDETAERISALAGVAEGVPSVVAKRTSLPSYPLNIKDGLDHVNALATALAAAGKGARAAIDRADELKDKDTADLFTAASRELDKQLWFVEAHLQADR